MDDNVRETARDIESADDRGAGIEAKEAERRHDSEHKNLIVGVGASAGRAGGAPAVLQRDAAH